MATDDDVLLDAFVRIGPDPDFLTVIDRMSDEAVRRITEKFATASIPAPSIAPIQTPPAPPTPPAPLTPPVSPTPPRTQAPPVPPVPPVPPGGNFVLKQMGDQILDATRKIEDMDRALRQLKTVGVEIGAENANKDLQILQNTLKDLQVAMTRANREQDLFGIDAAIDRVPILEERLETVSRQISQARRFREQFDELAFGGKGQIDSGRIRAGLQQSQIRGLPSGDLREQIVNQTAAIRMQEQAVSRLSKEFDGTEASVNRLRGAILALGDAQDTLDATQQLAMQTGRSFNTLSNNAYQLGQAFEDFSVGYSLNGFAGGIRGAANNVAFLLNDMSRLESVQKALPAGWAQQLPLIAGIGSGLAIVVLPKVIEWLETLNDVEVQIEDISKALQDNFDDLDFDINFRLSNDEFARTISSASSVKEILEQIRDIDFGVDDKQNQLTAIFEGLAQSGSKFSELTPQGAIKNQLSELNKGVVEELKKLDAIVNSRPPEGFIESILGRDDLARNLSDNARAALGFETTDTKLLQIKGFKDEVFAVQRSIDNVIEAGVSGNVSTDQLVLAQRQIATFNEFLKGNIDRLDISGDPKETAEKITGALDVFAGRLKEAEELSRKTANAVGEQLEIAIEGAVSKTQELADRQLLIRSRIEGTADAQAEFLMDVRETSQEYAKLIEQVSKFYSEQGKDPGPLVNQLRNQEIFRSENVVLEDQEKLIDDIKKAEDRLASLREKNDQKSKKSQFTNFEEFAKKLQTNVLSADPLDNNTKAINDLSYEIRQMNFRLAQRNATLENLPSQFTDPEGFQDRQRAIEFARPFDESQALKQMFDPTGLLFAIDQTAQRAGSPEFRPNEIAIAVQMGVENAMKKGMQPVVDEQKNTTDAVKKVKVGATAQ